jgi:hypothetical protein
MNNVSGISSDETHQKHHPPTSGRNARHLHVRTTARCRPLVSSEVSGHRAGGVNFAYLTNLILSPTVSRLAESERVELTIRIYTECSDARYHGHLAPAVEQT